MMSELMQKQTRILLAVALTLLIAAFILLDVSAGALMALMGAVLVFLLPGFACMQAVAPHAKLSISQELLFSLGLSISIVIVSGLLINVAGGRLVQTTWALWLCTLTLLFCAIALLRRLRTSATIPGETNHLPGLNLAQATQLLAAGILAARLAADPGTA